MRKRTSATGIEFHAGWIVGVIEAAFRIRGVSFGRILARSNFNMARAVPNAISTVSSGQNAVTLFAETEDPARSTHVARLVCHRAGRTDIGETEGSDRLFALRVFGRRQQGAFPSIDSPIRGCGTALCRLVCVCCRADISKFQLQQA